MWQTDMAGSSGRSCQEAPHRSGWLSRLARLVAALAVSLVVVVFGSVGSALPAHAASGDAIDNFTADYKLDTSGKLQVTETIVYRFGPGSGRHGLLRTYVTREPWDDSPSGKKQDAVYTYTIESVSSPSGAPARYSTEADTAGRDQSMTLKIGDPNRTVDAATATYKIVYTVTGVMRNSPGFDELFWDVTGFGWDAPMQKVSITATVPGGAQGLTCFAGPVKSTTQCTSAPDPAGGTVKITQANLPGNQNVSMGIKVKQGLVSDNAPHLKPADVNLAKPIAAGAFGLTTVGSIVVGIVYWRRKGRDLRYVGLPPGMVPTGGSNAAVGFSDAKLQIPVQFTPPRIPVAEAGLLVDGQVDTRETAATLVDLAVRGVIQLADSADSQIQVTLLDPAKTTSPHEMVLLTNLFNGQPPGAVVDLGARGSMITAHTALVAAVRNQVSDRGWFRKVPSSGKVLGGAATLIGVGVFAGFLHSASVLLLLIPLLPIVVTAAIVRSKLRRGQRTPDGRAVCDQVEGFKTYLATAEADQLRFEEGEDIFSRYLPWAMVFDLADRWTKICADLVAMGRIPDVQPYWYAGNFRMSTFNAGLLYGSLTTSATPVASSSGSSGSGFGGGSSFGGGGFSGGGGGGGGGGSW